MNFSICYKFILQYVSNAPLFTVYILNVPTAEIATLYLKKIIINISYKTKPYHKKLNSN